MGQYYLAYAKTGNKSPKIFDNKVDGDYNGLKLMEHSYFENRVVGNVINYLYHNVSRVCWVGDYYDENNYAQVNADPDTVKRIGNKVWGGESSGDTINTKTTEKNFMSSLGKLLVNHTKKEFINLSEFFESCKWRESYDWNGKHYEYDIAVHPLPLLTCSASHSGGSYYGTDKELCGTWFNDEIEVAGLSEESGLLKAGYQKFEPYFTERN